MPGFRGTPAGITGRVSHDVMCAIPAKRTNDLSAVEALLQSLGRWVVPLHFAFGIDMADISRNALYDIRQLFAAALLSWDFDRPGPPLISYSASLKLCQEQSRLMR